MPNNTILVASGSANMILRPGGAGKLRRRPGGGDERGLIIFNDIGHDRDGPCKYWQPESSLSVCSDATERANADKMPDVNWVNDEFELGFDETFEKRWRYVELVGRFVMTVFVAAALAGLLGQGPFSHHRAFDHNHSLAVDYEPIARQGTETQITFHILHAPPDATEIALTLSNGFGEPFNMASTVPLPERSIVGTNGTTLIFPIRPNDRDDLIRLKGTPSVTGPLQLSANLDNEPGVTWTHFVVP